VGRRLALTLAFLMVVTLAPIAHGRASAVVVTEPAPAAAQNIDNPITRENAQPGSTGWMHGPLLGEIGRAHV